MKARILIVLLSAIFIGIPMIIFAQQEQITITTYYPSPYGSYKELRAQHIAIGDNYINGSAYCWEGTCTATIDPNADLVVEGNVGIGTTSPAAPLHIRTTVGLSQLILQNVNGQWAVRTNDIAANDFGIRNITGGITPFYITSAGNVGIGTTSPVSGKLVVRGAGNTIIAQQEFAGNNNYVRFMDVNGSDLGWFGYGVANNGIELFTQGARPLVLGTNTSERIRIDASGNVGIGTAAPAGRLDVNGAIYQRGGLLHADYVFEPDFKLESIEEHAAYMWQNKHLKAIPKAMKDEKGQDVIEIGAMNKGILEELEKAHVYIEKLNNEIKSLRAEIESLK